MAKYFPQMQNVPHHLLSVYDPKEQINVTHFVSSAKMVNDMKLYTLMIRECFMSWVDSQAIDKIQGEGKVPIVVGGKFLQAIDI